MDTQQVDGIVQLLNKLTHTVQEISVRLDTLESKVSTRTRGDTCLTCDTCETSNTRKKNLDMYDKSDMYNNKLKNTCVTSWTCDTYDKTCDKWDIALDEKNQLTLHAEECNPKHLSMFLTRCQFESAEKFTDFFHQLKYYRGEHIREAMHATIKKITDGDPRGYFFAIARRLRTAAKQGNQQPNPQAWQPTPPPPNSGKLKTFQNFMQDHPEKASELEKLIAKYDNDKKQKPTDSNAAWDRAIKLVEDHEGQVAEQEQQAIDKANEGVEGLEELPF